MERGAALNLVSNNQETALSRAALNGHRAVVDLLLERGADPNKGGALLYAAGANRVDLMERLVATGGDVNARSSTGATALMAAAVRGRIDTVRWLLQHGADVTVRDAGGRTALQAARENGREDVAQLIANAAR